MTRKVMLSVCGKQAYMDQEPDKIELVTEGTMELRDGGWDICYEESDLTGLGGVTTTFRVEPGKVTLRHTGNLVSEMVFQQGLSHESLYQMPFGALLLRVTSKLVFFDIVEDGGTIDLSYDIDIENSAAGVIDYHLDIRAID